VILYPDGYEADYLTLDQMIQKHGPRMHPEFKRRFFAYIAHKAGLLGVGGGWRSTQPDLPGFAPDGKSFHLDQQYRSGFVGYAAVDLVTVDGPDVNDRHDGVTWAMTADAPQWGLHTFISGEPWHIQCIEMRGWTSWRDLGRFDPDPNFVLPGVEPDPPQPPQPPTNGEVDMMILDLNPGTDWWVAMVLDANSLSHLVDGYHVEVLMRGNVPRVQVDERDMEGVLRSVTTLNGSPFGSDRSSHNEMLNGLWNRARGSWAKEPR